MAAADPNNSELMQVESPGLMSNPIVRQLLVMFTLAGSIALGIVVVLWAWTPNFTVLYGSLTEKDASEIVTALQQAGIEVKVDPTTGSVMIPAADVDDARLKLASQGLPRGDGLGFELLQQETGFGTSRMVEAARYQRAMEGELARTISTLSSVQTARVHLAVPKQSVFVRKRKKTSASVVVKLFPGRILEKGHVASIVYMVSSSVPELEADNVTVVDQKGNMLSDQGGTSEMRLSSSQFDYTSKVEERYRSRIEDILTPILGADRVRAQVNAEVDFTLVEKTEESFNPNEQKELTLRSEQVNEENRQYSGVQGVPGALSNQPPGGSIAPERVGKVDEGNVVSQPINSSKQATRNYELDKTISHTRMPTTSLRRLSVAVVVDNPQVVGKKEEAKKDATVLAGRTPEELENITQLVKEAIGFNEERGDTVRVINAAFQLPPELAPLPEEAIWEKAWVWDVGRQTGGVLLVLVLIFVVLKPTMKKLLATPLMPPPAVPPVAALEGTNESRVELPGRGGYENTLEAARGMVQEDPKRVAQVVKKWVSEDG